MFGASIFSATTFRRKLYNLYINKRRVDKRYHLVIRDHEKENYFLVGALHCASRAVPIVIMVVVDGVAVVCRAAKLVSFLNWGQCGATTTTKIFFKIEADWL